MQAARLDCLMEMLQTPPMQAPPPPAVLGCDGAAVCGAQALPQHNACCGASYAS